MRMAPVAFEVAGQVWWTLTCRDGVSYRRRQNF